MKYEVWGTYDDGADEFFVDVFDTEEEAQMAINLLPDEDLVNYEIRKL